MKTRDSYDDKKESPYIHDTGGPLYRIAVRYMIDGEWHDIETIIQFLIPKVHPAKAHRRAERQRAHKGHQKPAPPPERVQNLDMDRIIRVGARAMARETLRNRAFEVNNDKQIIRIRPGKLAHAKEIVQRWHNEGGEAAFRDSVED